jgi:hypothetical protein
MATIGELTGMRQPLPCDRKEAHRSMGKARAALRARLKDDTKVREAKTLNAYKCPHCPFFHVGHKSR